MKGIDPIAAMAQMVAEVEKLLPTVTWKPVKVDAFPAFTGTDPTETWAFTIAGNGSQHEGVGIHEPSGTIIHLPPELAKRAWDLAKERA